MPSTPKGIWGMGRAGIHSLLGPEQLTGVLIFLHLKWSAQDLVYFRKLEKYNILWSVLQKEGATVIIYYY